MNYKDCKFRKFKYDSRRFKYRDDEGLERLIHEDKEVAKGKFVHSYDFQRWKYQDKENNWYEFNKL